VEKMVHNFPIHFAHTTPINHNDMPHKLQANQFSVLLLGLDVKNGLSQPHKLHYQQKCYLNSQSKKLVLG